MNLHISADIVVNSLSFIILFESSLIFLVNLVKVLSILIMFSKIALSFIDIFCVFSYLYFISFKSDFVISFCYFGLRLLFFFFYFLEVKVILIIADLSYFF